MNGYGSQRRSTAATLSAIQTTTTIVWTARKRPVPRNRAIPSANRPTASGSRRSRLPRPREARVWATRCSPGGSASATTGPLPPVLGEQVIEDVVDAHRTHQPALRVDDRGRDQ